ncbi:MAG: beta-lactamase family protein, partial [Woeseiaceae bacterium]|nr:beta-lactamase family protein [Woeseiaceae bacterium]
MGLFEHFDEGKQPGAAVVVIKDGRVILSRGFGYAHLENDTRIDENSSFRIGSLSKQFTTMALMVLAEDGKLNYDDLLSSHVPELHFWPGVTIRHLMNHTSGIPDYYEEEYYGNFDANNPMPQNSDIIKIMSLYPEADFAPGEQYVYNNAAYEVLVTVVERASGELFADFLKQRVFMPANMTTATTFNSSTPDIPNRVYGYDPTETGFELNDYDPFNDMLGAGSVYLTLKDLAAWDRSLDANSVVSDATLDQAYTSAQLNNGDAIGYGFGWEVGATRSHRRLAHTGSWVGFRTAIARFPDDNLTIAVLSNRGDGNPSAYVEKISDIYLSGRGTTYVPDESQTAVMNHHRKIPAEDHWWNVRGDEMGWMHRHVEQMFPTVTIYRNGPVRELEYEPRAEIAAVSIDTPDGPMPFGSFIQSDYSTAMGVVILHKGRIVFESYPR